MAKGKRSAALFEVIHSGSDFKPIKRKSRNWWPWKAAPSAADIFARHEAPESSPDDPTVGRDPQEMAAARARIAAAAAAIAEAEEAAANAAAARSSAPLAGNDAAGDLDFPTNIDPTPAQHPAGARSLSAGSGVDVAVDPERQQITFKFTYTSAIVAGFALVVCVMLAYLVGQKLSRGPALALATQTSEQLRAKPANPDVLNVAPHKAPTAPVNVGTQSQSVQQPAQQPAREPDSGTVSRAPESDFAESASATSNPLPRSINLNYILVQSYPDEKSANEARDVLQKAGIGCTVEQGLKGFKSDWFTVVTTKGFPRPSADEFKECVHRIEQVSAQYAQNKRSFKAFAPLGYKWDKPAPAGG